MIILNGDLLRTPFQIIAHQVNCHGVMGGGVALQIKNKYPDVYSVYRALCCEKCSADLLGKAQIVICRKIFFNVFGQDGYGSDKVQTDYDALHSGFINAISKFRDIWDVAQYINVVIAIPYKIGCGLAGGDWKKVKEILESLERMGNVTFVAYKYDKTGNDISASGENITIENVEQSNHGNNSICVKGNNCTISGITQC